MYSFTVGRPVRIISLKEQRPPTTVSSLVDEQLEVADTKPAAPGNVGHPQLIKVRITGRQGWTSEWISGGWLEPVGS